MVGYANPRSTASDRQPAEAKVFGVVVTNSPTLTQLYFLCGLRSFSATFQALYRGSNRLPGPAPASEAGFGMVVTKFLQGGRNFSFSLSLSL